MIVSHPNCKINLGLQIVSRRSDGYHNLQTIFYPVPLCDKLMIEKANCDSIEVTGIPIEGDPKDNLVWRAVELLRSEGYSISPVSIQLEKHIPSGAGLGGGSSDAAFAIKMLNQEFALAMTNERMEQLAAQLGADCAFFIQNKPTFATGIGNVFSPVALSLSDYYIIMVKPADFVSTREAFSTIVPKQPDVDLPQLVAKPIEEWAGEMKNDFEDSVFPLHPTIRHIRDELYQMGAAYAAMSGSGSCVYGLFRLPVNAIGQFDKHFCFASTLP